MKRTSYRTYYPSVTLEDIDNTERHMSKEELIELKDKQDTLISNLFGIQDIQTRALIEKFFRYGYYAAHIELGDGNPQ